MISIVMPAYNAGETIRQSLESVVIQSYTDWELIIVDDCSDDDTIEIVESFKKENEKYEVKLLVNPENRGVAYSRNRGIKEASGEWIAFLDSDDIWTSDKLQKQMVLIRDKGISEGLVFTGSSFITGKDTKIDFILRVPSEIRKDELLKQNLISCSSVLVSRSLMIKNSFPENIKSIHEDFAVWINILGDIPCAYGIDEQLMVYRVSDKSKSGKKTKAAIMNWNTYRYVGLGFTESIYEMIHYAIRGMCKWRKIRAKNKLIKKK